MKLKLLSIILLAVSLTFAEEEKKKDPVSLASGGDEQKKEPGQLVVKTIKLPKKCDVIAEAGDQLSVHYVGRLDDENGKQFDASKDRGFPFNFQLGAGQVIQGYEQGVPGMCKGEIRTLTVPSHLAYGDHGVPQAGIPGGATLHFTVELMNIVKGELKTIHPNIRIGGEL